MQGWDGIGEGGGVGGGVVCVSLSVCFVIISCFMTTKSCGTHTSPCRVIVELVVVRRCKSERRVFIAETHVLTYPLVFFSF